jgi:hypothetical protein
MILHYLFNDVKWDKRSWGLVLILIFYAFFAIQKNTLASGDSDFFLIIGCCFGYSSSLYSLQGNLTAGESKVFNLKYLLSVISSKTDFVLASMITSAVFSFIFFAIVIIILRIQNVVIMSSFFEHIPTSILGSMAIRVTIFEFYFKSILNLSSRKKQSIFFTLVYTLYKTATVLMYIFSFALVFIAFEMVKVPSYISWFIIVLLYIILKYKYVLKLWDDQTLAFIRLKRDMVSLGKLYLIPLAAFALVKIYGFVLVK